MQINGIVSPASSKLVQTPTEKPQSRGSSARSETGESPAAEATEGQVSQAQEGEAVQAKPTTSRLDIYV